MENKDLQARIGFSQGVYPDGWTGPESYIEFLNCATARVFYFIPNSSIDLEQKTVHFFDGESSGKSVAKRGEFHVIEAKRNPHGIVALQLYCNELESSSNGDSRPLGVLITRIELDGAQADIQFLPAEPRQISIFDLHSDYRVIENEFDRAFYNSFFSANLVPNNPVLHYLVAGWRDGREPTSWFSARDFWEKNPDADTEQEAPFVQLLTNGGTSNVDRPAVVEADLVTAAADAISSVAKIGQERVAETQAPMTPESLRDATLVSPPAGTHGFVEGGMVAAGMVGGVVYGWALHSPDALVWLEDEDGHAVDFRTIYRWKREDVGSAFPESSWKDIQSGFLAYVPSLTRSKKITLRINTSSGVSNLGERVGMTVLPADLKSVAECVFGLDTPMDTMHQRALAVDWPFLSAMQPDQRKSASGMSAARQYFGMLTSSPLVSIIIPLYGRYDFLEHQILEFAHDPFIRDQCEIIYVVDDPSILSQTLSLAEAVFRLTNVPFSVMSYGGNLGFSGANNAGASAARAPNLLFMNSDVIPQNPNWAQALLGRLQTEPNVGAVGPRLVFADGSIQHAGMAFEFNQKFGIWTNQHPLMGLDPALDTGPAVEEVPAVTGACVMLTREMFDKIGGWDTGYLIGDFEDSHLCLAIRSSGKSILYCRDVQLVHLERQSFKDLGEPSFRQKVVIANASRHQSLWSHMLTSEAK